MNFDVIEGLTKNQIEELYNEIIESSDNYFAAMYLYVKCDNGKRATFADPGYYQAYGVCSYGSNAEFAAVCAGIPNCGSICNVCGSCYEYAYQCNGIPAW